MSTATDFPLSVHKASNQYCKKIQGKVYYFGKLGGEQEKQAALEKYREFLKNPKKKKVKNGRKKSPSKNRVTKKKRDYKVRPDFPLTPHEASGQWCKRIKGRIYYFGVLAQPQAAEARYLAEKDYLEKGISPPTNGDGITLFDLCNDFRHQRKKLLRQGRLAQRTIDDDRREIGRLIEYFGKERLANSITKDEWSAYADELIQNRGYKLGYFKGIVTRTRAIFDWAAHPNQNLIDRPVYGDIFCLPEKRSLTKEKQENGIVRAYSREEILKMLEHAGPHAKAMVLLGINCGYGNGDCGQLEFKHLDLEGGWVNMPRPKNYKNRRCPLWPETKKALEDSIERRPEAKKSCEKYVFITKYGNNFYRRNNDAVAKMFTKLLNSCQIPSNLRGFYALRHVFLTVAETAGNPIAVDYMMGHLSRDRAMADVYREWIEDEKLIQVTDTVRNWLYA